jgi:hypothetical protein
VHVCVVRGYTATEHQRHDTGKKASLNIRGQFEKQMLSQNDRRCASCGQTDADVQGVLYVAFAKGLALPCMTSLQASLYFQTGHSCLARPAGLQEIPLSTMHG